MANYPRCRYQPSSDPSGFDSKMVASPEEEQADGPGWFDSPAEFGVETAPGIFPDPDISSKRKSADKTPADDPGSLGAVLSSAAGTKAVPAGPADPSADPRRTLRRSKA